jgi:hypothetical protein
MAKLLGSIAMTAVLLLAGSAFACPAEKSADASGLPVVTASKQSMPSSDQGPATDQTTKTKTTDTGTGG